MVSAWLERNDARGARRIVTSRKCLNLGMLATELTVIPLTNQCAVSQQDRADHRVW